MNSDEAQELQADTREAARLLTDVKEQEGDRRSPVKRSSGQDHVGRPSPQERRNTPLDQKRLEARRRSNRMSAQRARLRTKLTIRELEEGQAKLRAANTALRVQLEEALYQNQVLRRMMEEQQQEALTSNLALQRMLESRIAARRSHEVPPHGFPTSTPPPSTQFGSEDQAPFSESNAPSQRSAFITGGTNSSSNSQGMETVPADIKMQYIQQEIKALEESIKMHR
jgi:hypothetical protein